MPFSLLPMLAALPTSLLARWQLVVATTAVFNTVQNFLTLKLTRKIYSNIPPAQVTTLQARTFGLWTLTAAVVRFYAAFHIHNKTIYDMTMFTYLIAFGHFASELLIFRTANPGVAVISPVIVSTASLVWMINQYDFYVRT